MNLPSGGLGKKKQILHQVVMSAMGKMMAAWDYLHTVQKINLKNAKAANGKLGWIYNGPLIDYWLLTDV